MSIDRMIEKNKAKWMQRYELELNALVAATTGRVDWTVAERYWLDGVEAYQAAAWATGRTNMGGTAPRGGAS